jgi:hypothetical protein
LLLFFFLLFFFFFSSSSSSWGKTPGYSSVHLRHVDHWQWKRHVPSNRRERITTWSGIISQDNGIPSFLTNQLNYRLGIWRKTFLESQQVKIFLFLDLGSFLAVLARDPPTLVSVLRIVSF